MRGMEGGQDEQRHENGYLFGFFGVRILLFILGHDGELCRASNQIKWAGDKATKPSPRASLDGGGEQQTVNF